MATGSPQASIAKVHAPSSVGTTVACQRSVPGTPGTIRMNGAGRVPSGPRQATFAEIASWPSRNTVAATGRCSPTTARAG